jgi:hypothetical protein
MTKSNSDDPWVDPWAAWEALEARMVPRLDPRYGRCPVCRLPWTDPFQFGDGWYGRCRPDNTYALIGERTFDAIVYDDRGDGDEEDGLSPVEVQRIRDEFLYAGLLELARAQRVTPLFTTGEAMKKKTDVLIAIDPHDLLGPRESRIFGDAQKHERIAVTAHVIRYMQSVPWTRNHQGLGPQRPQQGCWDSIRYLPVDSQSTTVEQVLARPGNAPMLLDRLMDLLIKLHERGAELRQQLAQIDALGFDFPAAEEPVGGAVAR